MNFRESQPVGVGVDSTGHLGVDASGISFREAMGVDESIESFVSGEERELDVDSRSESLPRLGRQVRK